MVGRFLGDAGGDLRSLLLRPFLRLVPAAGTCPKNLIGPADGALNGTCPSLLPAPDPAVVLA